MYKTLSISILSTIFIGCSSTTALKHFNKNEIEAKAMPYTKKADVIINKEQKALLWATYLNNDKRYKDILSKNTWGKYYLVKFNQVENTYNLTLTLSNKNSNSAKLTFEK